MKIEGFGGIGREGWGGGRAAMIAMAALALSACTTVQAPEPRIIIQEVAKPVPVACVPKNLGQPPAYPDSDEALKSATPEGRYALLVAGRGLRIGRLGEVEPAIEGCRQ